MEYAFATLVTSDAYLPGALVVAAALRDIHAQAPASSDVPFHLVCIVTPETVDVKSIKLIRHAFDVVVGVEIISVGPSAGLDLLGRPDLETVLTKLHVFRLTQYKKIIFLDADVLPLRPISHLFLTPYEFSAVPDVGWPDIFNSGVMVLEPGEDKFSQVMQLVKSKGSWDGGDQGVLNEWRKGDWNRLSFTYNTTPTAAYTYAPAYARFGSQISVIHFIGPNKPWSSIPFRAPASQPSTSASQSYAYGDLVDRWFAVYDRIFRPVVRTVEPEYASQRYSSAWDSVAGSSARAASDVLDLDDLRRLAVEGVSGNLPSMHPQHPHQGGAGDYISLSLDGRVDLMRPQDTAIALPANEPGQAGAPTASVPIVTVTGAEVPSRDAPPRLSPLRTGSVLQASPPFPTHTLPTPGPHEVPHAPLQRAHSLPPVTPYAPPGVPFSYAHPTPYAPDDLPPAPLFHLSGPPPPLRPPSPTHVAWNPALEPPPSGPVPTPHFPIGPFFPNAWDIRVPPVSPHQSHEEQQAHRELQFFQPPGVPHIPEHLIEQRQYIAVTSDVARPQPDRGRVQTVFPWEERPRHAPRRVFPKSDTPPPGLPYIDETAPPPPVPIVEQTPAVTSPPHVPSPGLPMSVAYANAWDHVPSIQRYAARLMRPAPTASAPAHTDSPGTRRRRVSEGYPIWEEAEASSRDGDDEEEEEEEEHSESERSTLGGRDLSDADVAAGPPMPVRQDSAGPSATVAVARATPPFLPRSRRESRSGVSSGMKRDFRSQATQTPVREMQDRAVQAVRPRKPRPKQLGSMPPVPDDVRRLIPPTSDAGMLATPTATVPSSHARATHHDELASGALSPRMHDSYTFNTFTPSAPQNGERKDESGSSSVASPPTAATLQPSEKPVKLETSSPGPRIPPLHDSPTRHARGSPPPAHPTKTASIVTASRTPTGPELARPVLEQMPSDEMTLSPVSSLTPRSPADDEPVPMTLTARTPRMGGRSWDPARGVDVFKKGSEEVLARFLRMESWEEQAAHRRTASPV